jgi:tetratricopeptide (TPR) repeat protein
MKKSLLLAASLAFVLPALPVVPVHAQAGGVDAPMANTRAAKRAREAKASPASKAVPLFAKATRVEPKQAGAPALAKQLDALFKLQEAGDSDKAIAAADAILADPRALPFDKSSAGYIAGYAWLAKDSGNYLNASKYIQGAITDNGLSNNTHYQMMLQLAQMLTSDDKHAEALTYVDRYLTETGSEDPKAYILKSNILYQLKRYDDSAKVLEDVLAKQPKDKKLLMNLASIYQQSGKDAKAGEVFDRMRKQGLMTESKDYEAAYRLLANIDGRENEALAIINEGLEKGILTPGYDVYAFQGQAYYAADQIPKAIEAWSKGAPLSKNGEMYLNLGKLQADQEHWAEAKAAAKSALEKGVKKTGEAWQVIGRSEAALGNKAAATAAYRESAKYPETKKWADSVLRQGSGK